MEQCGESEEHDEEDCGTQRWVVMVEYEGWHTARVVASHGSRVVRESILLMKLSFVDVIILSVSRACGEIFL